MIRHIKLDAYKGIDSVKEIDFAEESIPYVLIIGDGATGKTSFIDFLKAMLTGNVTDDAVNKITDNAGGEIEFDKNGRRWKAVLKKTRKTDTLSLFVKDEGLDLWLRKGGREALRELVGEIWIDPIALQKKSAKDQIKWYKETCKLDTTTFDEQEKALSEDRVLTGRQKNDLAGFVNQSADVQDIEANAKMYAETKDLTQLSNRNQELKKIENDLSLAANKLGEHNDRIERSSREIKRLEDMILSERTKIEAATTDIEKINIFINSCDINSINEETKTIESEIRGIQDYNIKRNAFIQTYEKFKEFTKKENEYKALSEKIDSVRAAKAIYISAQKINVEGLEMKDEGLYYNDVPLSGLSTTEMVTLTKLIQQQINPNGLPVMIIDDFESIGSKGVEAIEKIAAEVSGIKIFLATMNRDEKTLKIELRDKL